MNATSVHGHFGTHEGLLKDAEVVPFVFSVQVLGFIVTNMR